MAENVFKYDVFVSYSSANKEWVRKTFVPILEIAGLKVCDYYRDFDVGASIVKEMERAVLESSKTIPVLSPAYLNSGWTEFESLMLQTLDAANRERKLLPVILESCELPLRIKYMNCINFANPDDIEIEWQRLSRALGVTLSPTITPISSTISDWYLAHPYPMPPNFTGRVAEQKMLDDWLADNTNCLFILRALGGFGKSALAWQWINTHVNPTEWNKLVFWSFYEGDASFEHFIEENLKYLKLEVPQGQRPQVDELLKAMQSQKILLIMDGFERVLRAYSGMNAVYQGDEPKVEDNQLDCVNINAEIFLKSVCSLPNIKGKVLMTTRLTPRAVKPRGEFMLGCREEELTAMQKADAVEFFHKQGIKGTHTEIEVACAPYGYHPLSLRLLAGRILKDFENPADIVVAQKLKIDGDIVQQKHHVLEVSYNSLPEYKQKLLSTIACFRSPVELKTLQSIAESKDYLNNNLRDLIERGLLHFDGENKKFDIHPIVRRYVYELLTAPDRTATHIRLRDYFAAVNIYIEPQTVDDLSPVIELYHHTVQAGEFRVARKLYQDRLKQSLYFRLAAYQTIIDLLYVLLPKDENYLSDLQKSDIAWILNELGKAYGAKGQLIRAITLLSQSLSISRELGSKAEVARALSNLANRYMDLGNLQKSIVALKDGEILCQEAQYRFLGAVIHRQRGRVMIYCGMWNEGKRELDIAYKFYEQERLIQAQGVVEAYRAQLTLLMSRDPMQTEINSWNLAIQFAQSAIKLIEERQKQTGRPNVRDFIRAYWIFGATLRCDGQLIYSERYLNEALTRCRTINLVENEANILLHLALLRYDQKNYEEAKSLADEALLITERCGYVLQGADVNLFLAQYALEQEKDKAKAKRYAETALKLAYCDGPPYYYKVAYHEAERFLENLE